MNQTFCLGLFEVTDILDYDPVRKEVYFMSTENPNLKPNEDEDPKLRPVSYTHLTLPTNREV